MNRITIGKFLLASVACIATASAQQGSLPVRWVVRPLLSARTVAFAPSGKRLAVGGRGGVQVKTTADPEFHNLPTRSYDVTAIKFAPDGRTLSVFGYDNVDFRLEIWNAETERLLATVPSDYTDSLPAFAFSPDGKSFAVGGVKLGAGSVKLYDTKEFHLVRSYATFATKVQALAFSADGSTIALGGTGPTGGILEFSDSAKGRVTRRVSMPGATSVPAIDFSPEGRYFADTYVDAYGISLELRKGTGAFLRRLPTHADYALNGVSFTSGGKLGLCGQTNAAPYGLMEVCFVEQGDRLFDLDTTGAATEFDGLSWSKGGQNLAGAGFNSFELDSGLSDPLEIWGRSLDLEATYQTALPVGYRNLAYSPDNRLLASDTGVRESGALTRLVELRDAATGNLRARLGTGATASVNALAFSKDSTLLACGGMADATTSSLELWNATSAQRFAILPTKLVNIQAIAFSPDGKTMAVSGADALSSAVVELWDLVTLSAMSIPIGVSGFAGSVAWTLDSQSIVVGGTGPAGGFTKEFRAKDGQSIMSFDFGSPTTLDTVAMSPDGQSIAIGGFINRPDTSWYGGIEIFSLSTGNWVLTVGDGFAGRVVPPMAYAARGNVLFVNEAAFSTFDGSQIFDGSNILGAQNVAISPDGLSIACTSLPLNRFGITVLGNPFANYGLLDSLSFLSSSVRPGGSTLATITLGSPAPVGGVRVALTCDDSSVKISHSAFVRAGQTTATFEVRVGPGALRSSSAITATLGGKSVTAVLTIP